MTSSKTSLHQALSLSTLDDILIMSKTKGEHRRIMHKVLRILQKNKLFLKAEKCEFETLETEYLGVIISEGSILHGPSQDRRDSEMACTDQETAVAIILRLHQLLLTFHQGIQQGCQTNDATNRKRSMEVGNSATERV